MKIKLFLFSTALILCCLSSCNKEHDNYRTVKKLFKIYEDGEINKCELDDKTVYVAGINAKDAGTQIFNTNGVQIGSCNYAWGSVDEICYEFENCNTIYRVEDNIWGRPGVDEYELGN